MLIILSIFLAFSFILLTTARNVFSLLQREIIYLYIKNWLPVVFQDKTLSTRMKGSSFTRTLRL